LLVLISIAAVVPVEARIVASTATVALVIGGLAIGFCLFLHFSRLVRCDQNLFVWVDRGNEVLRTVEAV
jgi:hypothetical protein